jgi:hypothetical protein
MRSRALILLGVGGAVAALALSALQARPSPGAQPGRPLELFHDGALALRKLEAPLVAWHGGPTVAQTGEQVTVYVSDSYTADQNDVQGWADFIAGLVHGPELGLLTAYIATPDEVEGLCGANALGCYEEDRLVAIGDPIDGVTPQEVVMHEYGHHVALNRLNAPWPAVDWGPKYWATEQNVCARADDLTAFPGDEGLEYRLNPGEAFAETYRVLNEDPTLVNAFDWSIVDRSFMPNAAALEAVKNDVLRPWTAPTRLVVHGRFNRRGRTTSATTVATPLDGAFSVSLTFPRSARDHIVVADGRGRVIARGARSGPSSEKVNGFVCGSRSERLMVSRRAGSGEFTLRISRP